MTNPIAEPFVVRELRGRFTVSSEVPVTEDGTFSVPHLPPGRYCFHTSSDEFQGYEGVIIIDPAAPSGATITIKVAMGV